MIPASHLPRAEDCISGGYFDRLTQYICDILEGLDNDKDMREHEKQCTACAYEVKEIIKDIKFNEQNPFTEREKRETDKLLSTDRSASIKKILNKLRQEGHL